MKVKTFLAENGINGLRDENLLEALAALRNALTRPLDKSERKAARDSVKRVMEGLFPASKVGRPRGREQKTDYAMERAVVDAGLRRLKRTGPATASRIAASFSTAKREFSKRRAETISALLSGVRPNFAEAALEVLSEFHGKAVGYMRNLEGQALKGPNIVREEKARWALNACIELLDIRQKLSESGVKPEALSGRGSELVKECLRLDPASLKRHVNALTLKTASRYYLRHFTELDALSELHCPEFGPPSDWTALLKRLQKPE